MEHFPSLHPGPKADFWRASEVVDEEAQITALEEKYRDELEVRVCQSFVVVARIFFCFTENYSIQCLMRKEAN